VGAGSLAHEHYARAGDTPGDRMTGDIRAGSAVMQRLEMAREFSVRGCYHCGGR
jgi:hypothetical protein